MEMMTQMPATELLMPLAAYKGKKRLLVVVGVVVAAIVLDLKAKLNTQHVSLTQNVEENEGRS